MENKKKTKKSSPCGTYNTIFARKLVTHHYDSSATIGRPRGSADAYKVIMMRCYGCPPGHRRRGGETGPRSRLLAPFDGCAVMTSTRVRGACEEQGNSIRRRPVFGGPSAFFPPKTDRQIIIIPM